MIINSELEFGRDILKNIPSQNRPNRTLILRNKYVTAKLGCGVIMILAKLHRKVRCLKWPKTAPDCTVK